jgi:hypothetical protein
MLYLQGSIVEHDKDKARYWYDQAGINMDDLA